MNRAVLSLAALSAKWLPMPIKRLFYRIRPLAHWLRASLNRAAPEGLTEVSIAAGRLAGYRMLLDLRLEKDYWLGTYEPELQEAVREFVKPGMIAYDVGGNIGYVTLMLAHAVGEGGLVFVFEPLPQNVKRLRENLALNRLESRVTIIPKAVVEATQEVRFRRGPSHGTGKVESAVGEEFALQGATMAVQGVSLDEFVFREGHPPPNVVKVDIEGGEVLALPGMREILHQMRPLLLLELHGTLASQVAWQVLVQASYSLRWMRRGYPVVKDAALLGRKAYIVGIPALVGLSSAD